MISFEDYWADREEAEELVENSDPTPTIDDPWWGGSRSDW